MRRGRPSDGVSGGRLWFERSGQAAAPAKASVCATTAPSATSMRRHVVSRPNVVGPADPGRPLYAFPETTLLFALIKDAIRRRCKLGSVPRLTLPTQRRSAGSGRGTQSSGRDFGRTLFFYNVISLVVSLCCAS